MCEDTELYTHGFIEITQHLPVMISPILQVGG